MITRPHNRRQEIAVSNLKVMPTKELVTWTDPRFITVHGDAVAVIMAKSVYDEYEAIVLACRELLDAPHQDHFVTRLNDEEMAALNKIKALVKHESAEVP